MGAESGARAAFRRQKRKDCPARKGRETTLLAPFMLPRFQEKSPDIREHRGLNSDDAQQGSVTHVHGDVLYVTDRVNTAHTRFFVAAGLTFLIVLY